MPDCYRSWIFLKEERKNFRRERVVEKHAHDYVSYVDKNLKCVW